MAATLLKILTRFKREDLPYLIEKWDSVEAEDFEDGESVEAFKELSKAKALQKILRVAKTKKLGTTDIAKADLICVQKYSTKKMWNMHQLEKIPGTSYPTRNAQEFGKRLKQQLKFHYKVDFELSVHKQAIWMRIAIRQPPREAVPFYVVHFPNTYFLATTGMKATHKQGLVKALLNVLECEDMQTLPLKGYHLFSLFQMVCNKYNQGEFDLYKEELKEDVVHTRMRSGGKRALSDDEEEHDDIVYEGETLSKKRRGILDSTLGADDLPILQKVEYKLDTKFRGCDYAPSMAGEMFHCKIKFEGANVLEGIRNLGKAGLAVLPMKSHVGKIHMLGRNDFMLRMKQSASTTDTNASHVNASVQVTPGNQGRT